MEFNAKKIDGANAVVTATLDKETLDKNLDKMAKQAAKNMSIQGFRKGKVPVAVVKQRHGDQLAQDAQSEALRTLVGDALAQLKIDNADIIGEPAVSKFDIKEDGSIDVEVKISSKPAVDLGDYEALLPEVTAKEVSDAEVDERIDTMAKSSAPLAKIKRKRMVRSGDFVIIDFEGFIDDVAFNGGTAKKHTLEIGSNSFIPGFEDQIIGMKYEETKDVVVKFPNKYQSEELAGKEATFKVLLHEIHEKGEAVIDDAFAAKVMPNEKDVTVELLKEKIAEQIKSEKMVKYYNEDLKPAYLADLVKNIAMDLPESIIDQEINNSLNNDLRALSEDELEKLRNDGDAVEKMRQDARPGAIDSVKATFIVDA
ncbi:MAG: trigger factor, partial [Campylobacterota bacterium]|nr:trigger factor [Campylobacterota bacterium]